MQCHTSGQTLHKKARFTTFLVFLPQLPNWKVSRVDFTFFKTLCGETRRQATRRKYEARKDGKIKKKRARPIRVEDGWRNSGRFQDAAGLAWRRGSGSVLRLRPWHRTLCELGYHEIAFKLDREVWLDFNMYRFMWRFQIRYEWMNRFQSLEGICCIYTGLCGNFKLDIYAWSEFSYRRVFVAYI